MDTCYAAGYSYAGVEYAAECYCGNAVVNGGTLEDDSGCNMPCQADILSYCGGPYRLNVYAYNGVVPPPTVPVGGGGPPPANGVTALTTGLPTGWEYKGCWIDGAYGRILPVGANLASPNTPASCIAACITLGYSIAGAEFSDECYCSNVLYNAAALGAEADCSMACAGDNVSICHSSRS
jgi:WSC domain